MSLQWLQGQQKHPPSHTVLLIWPYLGVVSSLQNGSQWTLPTGISPLIIVSSYNECGSACDLLQPTECGESDAVPVLDLNPEKTWQLLLLLFGEPWATIWEVWSTYWRDHSRRRSSKVSGNKKGPAVQLSLPNCQTCKVLDIQPSSVCKWV